MHRLILSICLSFALTGISGQKSEYICLDKNDATRNCYRILYPPTLPWTGYVVIIPGFGETPEQAMEQTDLPKMAAQQGLLTIIPLLCDGVYSFGADSESQQSLDKILDHVRNRHKLMDQPFYIGGFSIGGSCAIKYAQKTTPRPKAVFAIDPPLDFERFYHACLRNVRLSKADKPNPESVYMIDRITEECGGPPETERANYQKISAYSFSDTTQAALKRFGNTPLRIYSEPDVDWWLQERNADLTSMNVTDCSAMINELRRLGNKDAERILTQNRGYRAPDHRRHPHSWSIVENDALIEWMLKQR